MRVRSDLTGCVYVGMDPFFAGDVVPGGVVDPIYLEPESPGSDSQAGVPEVELGEFDPSTASVRTVREHLALNPGDKERVLALEAAGRARTSLIGE